MCTNTKWIFPIWYKIKNLKIDFLKNLKLLNVCIILFLFFIIGNRSSNVDKIGQEKKFKTIIILLNIWAYLWNVYADIDW